MDLCPKAKTALEALLGLSDEQMTEIGKVLFVASLPKLDNTYLASFSAACIQELSQRASAVERACASSASPPSADDV